MKSNSNYEQKLLSGNTSERVLLELLWDVDALKKLEDKARALETDFSVCLDLLDLTEDQQVKENLPQKLSVLRTRLQDVIKGVFRWRRSPATHMFVLMISSELRNKKPYAVPVQCIPYAGIRESDIRQLINLLIKEMVGIGMKVAGK